MFSQDIADSICARIAGGESLRAAAAEAGISHATFLLWCSERPELADQYAHAREAGADVEFEALTEHADAEPERDEKGKIDPGWVQLQKLKIDVRKWTLARKAPKKYGDKVQAEVEHTTGKRFEISFVTPTRSSEA